MVTIPLIFLVILFSRWFGIMVTLPLLFPGILFSRGLVTLILCQYYFKLFFSVVCIGNMVTIPLLFPVILFALWFGNMVTMPILFPVIFFFSSSVTLSLCHKHFQLFYFSVVR